jgi:hypothetical protein
MLLSQELQIDQSVEVFREWQPRLAPLNFLINVQSFADEDLQVSTIQPISRMI